MKKIIPVFAIACLGAAAASLLTVFRAKQRAVKTQEKEDIERWEADGVKVPLKSVPSAGQKTTSNATN